jgi:hypothetical protein
VYHTLTGVDISQEMVDFANKTFADETTTFHCMDIAKVRCHNYIFKKTLEKRRFG